MADIFRSAVEAREIHMVTRDTGRRVRAEAARIVASLEEGGLLTLDFDGVGIIDYSCADEFLAKLLTRLIAGEYGEKYVCLSNLNASQEENIAVALEKKRLSALLANPDSTWKCLGILKPYLRQTLDLVMDRETVSARELCTLLSLALNTSSTRLINLHRQRLVIRHERFIAEGGREFIYAGLFSHSSQESRHA
jgi:hypothetical protein